MNLLDVHPAVSLMNSVLAPTGAVGSSATSGEVDKPSVNFDSVPKFSLGRVNVSQQKAEPISRSSGMGDSDVDLHDMMFSLQKANIDMQATAQVRSKLVLAYQSIMSVSI